MEIPRQHDDGLFFLCLDTFFHLSVCKLHETSLALFFIPAESLFLSSRLPTHTHSCLRDCVAKPVNHSFFLMSLLIYSSLASTMWMAEKRDGCTKQWMCGIPTSFMDP